MAAESRDNEYILYLVELFQIVGAATAKKMFGGYGLFLDGLMFALVAEGTLYLKADGQSEDMFKEKGMEKFVYYKKGKPFSISYYQAPDEVFEDEGEMKAWGNKAYAAALRAAGKKRKK